MVVTIEQINAGVMKFVESQIMPKANDIGKFVIGFTIPSIPAKVTSMLNQYKETGMINEFFDESGNIKLDDAYQRAKDTIAKIGKIHIPQLKYNVDAEDIDILYNLIKNI